MSNKVIRQELLGLTVEDSYGLWELLGRVRGLYPAMDEVEARRLTAITILELLTNGWVVLYRRPLLAPPASERKPIARDEADLLLANPKNWREPTGDDEVVVAEATSAGERAYYSGPDANS
jgi:hypothetical protein